MSHKILNIIAAALLAAPATTGAAQTGPLTLPQAVTMALEKSPQRRISLADLQMAEAGVSATSSVFFPKIDLTESATDGNDPVYAFGTKLRQARFTAADFVPSALNHPNPIGNFSSRIEGQWTLFDSFAGYAQLRRARLLRQAAQQQLSRADQQLVFRVLDAYYQVLLARRQVELAEKVVATAQALTDSAAARVSAGTSVPSDELSARVNLAARQQELIRARSALSMAMAELEIVLGSRLTAEQQPAGELRELNLPPAQLDELESWAIQQRPDLLALADQVEAQQNGVRAAKSAFFPQVNVVGSWQADNSSFAANGSSNWMVGAELRVDLFAHEKISRLAMERAGLNKMEAVRQIAADNIRLEVRRAYYEQDAARQMLEVSRAAVAQAEESLRITRDRYESGLATITDLLRAEDATRGARNNYVQSVYHYVLSYAALKLASGDLTPQSKVITQ